MSFSNQHRTKPFLILGLNVLVYISIFLLRNYFFSNPYTSIEYSLWLPSLYAVPFIGGLLFLYFLGYKNIGFFSLKLLLSGYFVFSFILLFTPTLLSTDLYIYAMRGRVWAIHHQNPYLIAASNFPEDPFLEFTGKAWRHLPQNYGPLWTMISGALTWLGRESFFFTFFLFKFFGLIGNSLSLYLLYKISKIYHPGKKKEIFFLYAWNPFILIEFINNAHNDVWMIFFGLLAFYFLFTKRNNLIIPNLVMAGLIKYVYWLLIPLFLFFFQKQERIPWKTILVGGILSLTLLITFYFPFWKGKETLAGIINQAGFQNRPLNHWNPLLVLGIFFFWSFLASGALHFVLMALSGLQWLGRGIFSLFYLKQFFLKREIIDVSIPILSLFALLATGTFLPWYITWWFPFLVLKNNWQSALFWTTIGLWAYFFLYSTSLALLTIGVVWFGFIKIFKQFQKE